MRHPGLPVATTWGRASAREASLGASTARDIMGSTRVNSPALPQHCAASGIEIRRSTGIARSIRSGGSAIRWAWSRWQGGSYATVTSSGAPGRGPRSANSSLTSRTRAPLGQQLTYVPHAGRESLPLLRDVDQVAVLLQHRPAPCAVDDDGCIVVAEGGEVGAREPSRLVPQTGVRVQRATANLRRGFAHRVAVHLQR